MEALLIIDMQNISFTPETPRWDSDGVIQRINTLATSFRKKGQPVIYIQHDGSKDNFCLPSSKEWKVLDSLDVHCNDLAISKIANNSFYKSILHTTLQQLNIDKLTITGCATDFCVDSTIKSAINHEYKVTVISDAHTTGDRPHLKAKQVIEHYNWIWKETIPINGNKIKVLSLDEYLN
ncbi:MAG: cysteine hydrolase [Bacteroidales bacterium]|nr:cysteine hydrolase [Bacteroidales bacterium]